MSRPALLLPSSVNIAIKRGPMTHSTVNETVGSGRFMNLVSLAGLGIFVFAAFEVASLPLNLQLILLCLVAALVVSNSDIQLPKIPGTVTLDDTFIYLCFLLYGQWPSVVLAGINAQITEALLALGTGITNAGARVEFAEPFRGNGGSDTWWQWRLGRCGWGGLAQRRRVLRGFVFQRHFHLSQPQ